MSIASKYAGEGRIGHGYKTKMKPVDRVRNKVANFADTINHKYSRYIVDFAVKNKCRVIQMEDLSGITANTHEKFLKEWSYHDLQTKIEYKAEVYLGFIFTTWIPTSSALYSILVCKSW